MDIDRKLRGVWEIGKLLAPQPKTDIWLHGGWGGGVEGCDRRIKRISIEILFRITITGSRSTLEFPSWVNLSGLRTGLAGATTLTRSDFMPHIA